MGKNRSQNGLPAAKQKRGKETIDAVLAVTAKVISEQGESRVRIQEISEATDVSIGSIYHHFGNREGLILAAYVDNFTKGYRRDLEILVTWLDSVTDLSHLTLETDRIRNLADSHWSDDLALHRIAILGSIQGRPKLQEALRQVQTELFDRFAASIERLQNLGFLKNHLSARAVAVMGTGMVLGRAISELDGSAVGNNDWNQVMLEMLSGLIPLELLVGSAS